MQNTNNNTAQHITTHNVDLEAGITQKFADMYDALYEVDNNRNRYKSVHLRIIHADDVTVDTNLVCEGWVCTARQEGNITTINYDPKAEIATLQKERDELEQQCADYEELIDTLMDVIYEAQAVFDEQTYMAKRAFDDVSKVL
jgi:hypothetical protein